jgi:uncharacterized protein YjbI with pentapeptide repeats
MYFSAQSSLQATEQSRENQASQTSERFSRSVEQLGSNNITVRIGAVYSFARLIRDSNTDQPAIGEILSSFIRLQAVAQPRVAKDQRYRPVPADMIAALKVLQEQPKDTTLLRLRPMQLTGVDLSRFNLDGVVMTNADLIGADLTGTNLGFANLTNANLEGATLDGTILTGANLTGANLTGAVLGLTYAVSATLDGANLTGADLTGVSLAGANLAGADLTGANLAGADLGNANLTDVTCSKLTQWPMDLQARDRPC